MAYQFDESNIRSLSPKILEDKELEEASPYLNELYSAIKDSYASNIALTGEYGSGKSSIISTFQKKCKDYNYIKISLASFNDNSIKRTESQVKQKADTLEETIKKEEGEKKKKNRKRQFYKEIEISILQQLFYHSDPKDIPESRFKRIEASNTEITNIKSFFLTFFLILSTIFIYLKGYENISFEFWKSSFNFQNVFFDIIFVWLSYCLYEIIKWSYRKLKGHNISNLSLKGEIGFNKNIEKSILNEHFDEILYFFESTDYNVIFFEDIDRFNELSVHIFTKLRELNLILNNAKSISSKGQIVFVYAICDNVFETFNKVKFFDYIIPIIPIVSSLNAGDQLAKLIASDGYIIKPGESDNNSFSEDFIYDISIVLDSIDMRMLINVLNEFSVYKQRIKKNVPNLKLDNLLAILLYKNFEQRDFAKLSRKQGNLYKLITNKKEYIEQIKLIIEKEIKSNKDKLSEADNRDFEDKNELIKATINKLINSLTNPVSFRIGSAFHPIINFYEESLFKELRNEQYIIYQKYSPPSSLQVINSNNDLDTLTTNHFKVNHQKLSLENQNRIVDLNQKIDSLEKEVEKLNQLSISEIFGKISIDQYLNDFTEKNIISNLITNGYIDESYTFYISVFHESSLKASDNEFIFNTINGAKSNFNHELSNPKEVIQRIPLRHFKKHSILNFSILSFLIENRNKPKFKDKFSMFFKHFSEINLLTKSNDEIIQFTELYLFHLLEANQKNLVIFLKKLLSETETFIIILNDSFKTSFNKNKENWIKIFDSIISNVNYTTIQGVRKLTNFFADNNLYFENNFEKAKDFIKNGGVKYKQIPQLTEENSILHLFLYHGQYFKLNYENIVCILKSYGDESINPDTKINYSSIQKSTCQHLKEYISANINDFIKEYCSAGSKFNHDDDSKYLEELINHPKLNDENKTSIISRSDSRIEHLSNINDDNLNLVLSNYKFIPNWKNILFIFEKNNNSLSDYIIPFLNNLLGMNKEDIVISFINSIDKNNVEFLNLLFNNNELNDNIYRDIVNIIPPREELIINNIEDLSTTKVKYLIYNYFLPFNYEIASEVRIHHPNLIIHFLTLHRDDDTFLEIIEELDLDQNEFIEILKHGAFSTMEKIEILKIFITNEPDINQELSSLISELVTIKNVRISNEVLYAIITHIDTIENKETLIFNNFESIERSEIVNIIGDFSQDHKRMFLKLNHPLLDVQKSTFDLCGKLKEINLIGKFSLEQDNTKIRVNALGTIKY